MLALDDAVLLASASVPLASVAVVPMAQPTRPEMLYVHKCSTPFGITDPFAQAGLNSFPTYF